MAYITTVVIPVRTPEQIRALVDSSPENDFTHFLLLM